MTELAPEKFYRKWSQIALHFFLISALIGSLLRYYNVSFIGSINYRNLVHAHSHVAMLGWLHLGFTTLLIYYLRHNHFTRFRNVQLLTLVSLMGMLLSFPFEGYGLFSISFSTLFVLATYWFTYLFFTTRDNTAEDSIADKTARWSLGFLVISSFGPWTLGPLMVWGDGTEVLYNLSVYFYLHFAYNGFFQIAALALVLSAFNSTNEYKRKINWVAWLMIGSVIPTYALSALWTEPAPWVWIAGFVSGVMQLAGIVIGIPLLRKYVRSFSSGFARLVMLITVMSWLVKNLLQTISAVPILQQFTYDTRVYTVIGFIHLVMLGFLSMFIISIGIEIFVYRQRALAKTGLFILLTGLVISEAMLFGNSLWLQIKSELLEFYPEGMLLSAVTMTIGILLFWLNQFVINKGR